MTLNPDPTARTYWNEAGTVQAMQQKVGLYKAPAWLLAEYDAGNVVLDPFRGMFLRTEEGLLLCASGDWIVLSAAGELQVIPDDLFRKHYAVMP